MKMIKINNKDLNQYNKTVNSQQVLIKLYNNNKIKHLVYVTIIKKQPQSNPNPLSNYNKKNFNNPT